MGEDRQSYEDDENRLKAPKTRDCALSTRTTSPVHRDVRGWRKVLAQRLWTEGLDAPRRVGGYQTSSQSDTMPGAPDFLPSARRSRNSRISGRTAGFTPYIAGLDSDCIFRDPLKLRWRPAMDESHAGYKALVRKDEECRSPRH